MATVSLAAPFVFVPGQASNLAITGVTPSGFNQTNVSATFTNSTHFTFPLASNPGAYVSGGTVRNYNPAGPTYQATQGEITGNAISMTGTRTTLAGVWLNGLGASGNGVSDFKVTGNAVQGDGASVLICYRVSGTSNDDIVSHNSCENGQSGSQGASANADSAGTASGTIFSNNVFNGIIVSSGGVGMIGLNGPNAVAFGNQILGGTYPSCFYISSTGNVALNNPCTPGTAGMCDRAPPEETQT